MAPRPTDPAPPLPPPSPAPTPAPGPASTHQMWGGRFSLGPSEALDALNRSLPTDHRLWPQDVVASKAWVHALRRVGVLTPEEETELLDGLDRVADRLADGAALGAPDEDVHTLVERLLYETVGAVAGKLHTGRSRNDQVATDLRLWMLEAIDQLDRDLAGLGRSLLARAAEGVEILLPGYTHGQRAQPVRWAHVLLAHTWPLVRDRQRLADARRRTAELPLGSGALAGSGFGVDRVLLKEALGFRAISANALDATGDRDFVAEGLFVLSLAGLHVSRLAAELLLYTSAEFGFVRLSDDFSTGSSLLPQKRNPDVLELARAKAGRVVGDLVALLTTLKGLPAGYSKDLQEDKALVFDAFDTLSLVLPALTGAITALTVDPERMRGALDASLRATDLADHLVEAGVPFRESHGLVGRLVREAERSGVPLDQVPVARAAAIHPALGAALGRLGTWEDSIERRATPGGASRRSVEEQLAALALAFATTPSA
ncbi:MAG TPA: argininosuccinate lyase [Gemmatimonadales bacterium]|nr:argininosuccinate lyase [Gemmatimonadales bacterium]